MTATTMKTTARRRRLRGGRSAAAALAAALLSPSPLVVAFSPAPSKTSPGCAGTPPLFAAPPHLMLDVIDASLIDRSALILLSSGGASGFPEVVTPALFLSSVLGAVVGLPPSALAPGIIALKEMAMMSDALPFAALASVGAGLYQLSHPSEGYRSGMEPYARGSYDPVSARAYYSRRPLLVSRRLLQLLRVSLGFLAGLWFDKNVTKSEERNRKARASELLELIRRAGPTAVKVGQALSVRPDLVPYEYANALATLQDRVTPFPSGDARDLAVAELGAAGAGRIKGLDWSAGPVASASIGQVYKAEYEPDDDDGGGAAYSIAVKVQRPDALAEIALDLYLVRDVIAPVYKALTGTATDLRALANEWGRGFVAELDYRTEASKTTAFNEGMRSRGLTSAFAPKVVPSLSSGRVLTTRWVDGVRLDESDADDVPRLCGVALNAFLVMLLEIGTLHCDPHPGNLLRTPEGRLCILDWGMTVDVDPALQYSLLEFVAHLTGESYNEVPDDLVKLGFLREERLDTVRASGFLEPLVFILKQAREGGGGDQG